MYVGLVAVNFPPRSSICVELVGMYWELTWQESQGDTQLSLVSLGVSKILDFQGPGYQWRSNVRTVVIGHDIGGKYIPIMARLAKGQTLE